MSAQLPLYQVITQRLTAALAMHLPHSASVRLALLVTGMLAANSAVIAQLASALDARALSRATTTERIARRLRRTRNDPQLDQAPCSAPVLHQVINWDEVLRGSRRVVIIIDASSKADALQRFRVSLPYWGGALPLAWVVWQQNMPLPAGYDWTAVDQVLDQVAPRLPAGLEVVVVADRA